ncbi:MAG: HAD family hydrolase [Lysobacterales bacterium]|jgi:phosphoglycolate phosphatase-like HAD superfamily hydrolase
MSVTIKADAVLWDFDGTLADTAAKNMAISKQILARVAPRLTGENLPGCLSNDDAYHAAIHDVHDWRELYRDHFGMTREEIETAGPLWEPYQLRNTTPVALFDGVRETVIRLAPLPQGICSANATRNILQVIAESGIDPYFRAVVGYEDLQHYQQKPAPDGGLRCLREIFSEPRGKSVVYVGDHIADVLFARGLAELLGPTSAVTSVILTHSGAQPHQWPEQPDLVIEKPNELLELLLQ